MGLIKNTNKQTQFTISLSYSGNGLKNLTVDPDLKGNTIPVGSVGDIIRIFDRTAGNVRYSFDGDPPTVDSPYATGNQSFNVCENVKFDDFLVQATAGGSNYSLILRLNK